jgi:hypothetical protein
MRSFASSLALMLKKSSLMHLSLEFTTKRWCYFTINTTITPLSVVPLKIWKNNCNPGETYRKTPSICRTPTLYRANFAEDRHQHSRGDYLFFHLQRKEARYGNTSKVRFAALFVWGGITK